MEVRLPVLAQPVVSPAAADPELGPHTWVLPLDEELVHVSQVPMAVLLSVATVVLTLVPVQYEGHLRLSYV